MTPAGVTPRRWHVYIVDLEPRVGTKPGCAFKPPSREVMIGGADAAANFKATCE